MKTKEVKTNTEQQLTGKQLARLLSENDIQELTPYETSANGVQAAENDIVTHSVNYLYNACMDVINRYEIENDCNVIDLSQLQYNDVLMTICDDVIKPLPIDYRDILLLNNIATVYRKICYRTNKTISLYGYSLITDIPYITIKSWNNKHNNNSVYIDITKGKIIENTSLSFYKYNYPDSTICKLPNDNYYILCQKIRAERETNLTSKAENGSVMSLALGKIEYGWIEGKDKQLQADILQSTYSLPDDVLDKYK